MKLIPFVILLIGVSGTLLSCKTETLPGSGPSLSLTVTDVNGNPIPEAWISVPGSEEAFNRLVQTDGNPYFNYTDRTDAKGKAMVSVAATQIEKDTKIYFFIRAYPEQNAFVEDTLNNKGGVHFFVFKNDKPKIYELDVVLRANQ